MKTAPSPVADAALCVQCGYEVGAETAVCPECGAAVTADTRRQAAARVRLVENLGREFGRAHAAQGAAAFAVVLTAIFLGGSWGAAIVIGLAGALLSAAGTALGLLTSLAAGAGRRRLHLAMWQRSVVILHLPWMGIPVFAVLLYAISLVVEVSGQSTALVPFAAFLLGLFWFVLAVLALGWWSTRWVDDTREVGVWNTGGTDLAVLAAFVQLLASGIAGFIGAAVTTIALSETLPRH